MVTPRLGHPEKSWLVHVSSQVFLFFLDFLPFFCFFSFSSFSRLFFWSLSCAQITPFLCFLLFLVSQGIQQASLDSRPVSVELLACPDLGRSSGSSFFGQCRTTQHSTPPPTVAGSSYLSSPSGRGSCPAAVVRLSLSFARLPALFRAAARLRPELSVSQDAPGAASASS